MLTGRFAMLTSQHHFEKYIHETLGISTRLKRWEKENRLPPYLQDLYCVYTCLLGDITCLVIASRDVEEARPSLISKHIKKIEEIEPENKVIYLHPSISSYNRKRLIVQKIPFVVPGKQMYLPFMGVDLREYFQKVQTEKPVQLKPSTQAAFLAALYSYSEKGLTPAQLAVDLKYSRMTMSRAFGEMQRAGLGTITTVGRERVLRFSGNSKTLFKQAQPLLISPVRKKLKVLGNISLSGLVLAGESALSKYSMLSKPVHAVYAASSKTWKQKERTEHIISVPMHEAGSIEIEIWKYPPELFARDLVADPLSLYLSLRDIQDERVEIALENLLEELRW
jgi:DNA-binding MarR family transcriptional regulator